MYTITMLTIILINICYVNTRIQELGRDEPGRLQYSVQWPQHKVSDDMCSFGQVNKRKRLNVSGVISSSTHLLRATCSQRYPTAHVNRRGAGGGSRS